MGWSFVGKKLSTLLPIKVLFKPFHANKASRVLGRLHLARRKATVCFWLTYSIRANVHVTQAFGKHCVKYISTYTLTQSLIKHQRVTRCI